MATNPQGGASEAEKADMTRRAFFGAVGFGALAATLGATAIGGIRYIFPNVLYEPSNRIKIGLPAKFGAGTVTFIAEKKVFIRRVAEGFQAISAVCQHLGCTVNWTGTDFICPCHGSIYSADGKVVAGPAPRALDHFSIETSRDGQMVVDLSKVITLTDFYKA
ncbi:MAG TPA: Rieske 2Fe-2S domain-containing protein [Pantanalinema sp.]